MIGVPYNDLRCLSAITDVVANLVAQHDPLLAEIAARHATTAALAAWIRGLPQLDDDGAAPRDEQVRTCRPPQRLRLPAPDPNCVERAALYLAVAELIDPQPTRQLATLDTPAGLHTFPLENGGPVILDPTMPRNCITCGLAALAPEPLAIDPQDALAWTTQLATVQAAPWRNGPARVHRARNAVLDITQGHEPSAQALDDVAWLFALAGKDVQRYGARALDIVRATATAVSDLIDEITARRRQRNLALTIGAHRYRPTPWVAALATASARVGARVGASALRAQLAQLGVSGPLLAELERELNREGHSLGPLATVA